jgi:hypothetical protein
MLEVDRQSGGFTPRNVYPACPVGRNYRTGVESITIPLEFCNSNIRFSQKSSTSSVLVELFYVYSGK